ncbi:MAG: hypothetical protein WCC28_01530 [Mycobacterium sp.]|uniref:hypothetical protein n=1 Tax=Mycobacterium sp. TaxID=1785 RepID=UPI003C758FD8
MTGPLPSPHSTVSDLLAAEFDRRKTLEGRGAALMTASVCLVTLIFALTVILTGKDHVFANRYAVYFLLAALVSFVISAVIAIMVQTRGFNYVRHLSGSPTRMRPLGYVGR